MSTHSLILDELDVLSGLVSLPKARLIELGCGAAHLARNLVTRFADAHVIGLETDMRQHAKNLAAPQAGLVFLAGSAEFIPLPDNSFDGALMLKSLHHVPVDQMAQALAEVARVLRPGGWLYVSEPVYDGALNEIVKLYNDEGVVRAAAQAALDAAIASGTWREEARERFDMPARFASIEAFEQRMLFPTFVDHAIDDAKRAEVQAALRPHLRPDGLVFTRPMLVRLLRRHA